MECSIEGCEGKHLSRGWCTKHYYRWKRTGDPNVTTRTPPMAKDAVTRFCPKCELTKRLNEFGKRKSGALAGWCTSCSKAYDKAYAESEVGREARRAARATWNTDNHEYFLQYRYGIGRADYDRMLTEQDGRCGICRTDEPGSRNSVWPVDHCHTTNKVRGLLCHRCNMALGYFKDDPVRIAAALAYLAK